MFVPRPVTLTPSRSLSRTSRPHAILIAVDLCYIWKTIGNRRNSTKLLNDANPFAVHLYLPFEFLLNRVTEQFFTNQLVGRYPLIFGTWCRRLDMEAEYFPSVAHSILEIIHRSPNPHFVTRCKRLIKTARARHQSVLQASAAALSLCFAPSDAEDSEEIEGTNASTLTPDAVLCETLEQLFRAGVPHTRFKVIAARSTLFSSSVGDDDQLVEPSKDDAILNSDFSLIWPSLPDIHIDISTGVDDTQQTVPDDMDSDIDDWPKEASLGYTFPDTHPAWITHPGGSLINGLDPDSSGITPPVAGSSPTGSEESEDDDSFALDLGPDHEPENVNVDMEDAEFKRAVFHSSSLSGHHSPQSRNGGFLAFPGCQEEHGELENFDALVDAAFENGEQWSCEEEMLFDLADVLDESAGFGVEAGPLCVSQVPKCAPDQEVFFQVTSKTAEQDYAFDTPFDADDQVDQGTSEDSFTDVWDL
ncbi:hypothetical protein AZE42_06737 [Rhizopogon vesiculosus]|uniref:Uncharacterized protein n=1 Tax=Rhizopogon vesiculosus TaxID=180088 RepID=A0A1J8Q240_9AGAM|nr:hypothetical protein AZE42_06737 [Rhizopogon vesiculosus]